MKFFVYATFIFLLSSIASANEPVSCNVFTVYKDGHDVNKGVSFISDPLPGAPEALVGFVEVDEVRVEIRAFGSPDRTYVTILFNDFKAKHLLGETQAVLYLDARASATTQRSDKLVIVSCGRN